MIIHAVLLCVLRTESVHWWISVNLSLRNLSTHIYKYEHV